MNLGQQINQKGVAPILVLIAIVGVLAFLAISTSAPLKNTLLSTLFPKPASYAATAVPNCWPTSGPGFAGTLAGQPNAIWCYTDYSDGPSTAIKGNNTWVDNFNHGLTLGKFDSVNYTDFPMIGSGYKSQLFRHGNHWMRDVSGVSQEACSAVTCGPWDFMASLMRPNATFQAENGKLVIEADVATRVAAYGANQFWPEFVITTADHPGAPFPPGAPQFQGDIRFAGTYVYETFPGSWTLGCRLQNDGGFTCALLDDGFGGDTPSRVFELSHFQCGNSEDSVHPGSLYGCNQKYGGIPSNLPAADALFSRNCDTLDPDTNCRDRWRWEITNNRLTWFANGKRYMEHWDFEPAAQAALDQLLTRPVYVYFGEFVYKLGTPARMHWDRIAINPKDAQGNILPPSTAETFCAGQPLNTCGATPPPSPAPSPSTSGNSVLTTFEAENGTITAPFTAANGTVSQTVDTQTDPMSGGKATYTFNAPVAGNYIVKATVTALDANSDSLFVNIDNEPTTSNIWDIPVTGASGAERTVRWRPATTDKVFNLTAGSHTLIIRGREPNVKVDKVKIEFLGQLPSSTPSPSSSTKIGDISGPTGTKDSIVDMWDYNQLLTDLINNPRDPNAKGNIDGIVTAQGIAVDIFDYNLLLGNFGK